MVSARDRASISDVLKVSAGVLLGKTLSTSDGLRDGFPFLV